MMFTVFHMPCCHHPAYYADKDEASIAALDITNDFHLFLWDGAEVGGEPVLVGDAYEPVQLLVTYPVCAGEGDDDEEEGEVEVALAFTKDSTLWEVRVRIYIHVVAYTYIHTYIYSLGVWDLDICRSKCHSSSSMSFSPFQECNIQTPDVVVYKSRWL